MDTKLVSHTAHFIHISKSDSTDIECFLPDFSEDFFTLVFDFERRNLLTEEMRYKLVERCQETIWTLIYLRHSRHRIWQVDELVTNAKFVYKKCIASCEWVGPRCS